MSNVQVDPEKLREFAKVLKDFSKHSEELLGILSRELGRLQNSWRDQEFEKFASHVRRTQSRLKAFAQETARVVPTLEQDAEKLAQYQKVQLPE